MNSNVVAFILARAGSKGLPGKNVRLLAGKPLIVWSVAEALKSKRLSRIFVSTDGSDIASIAEEAGAEVLHRPAELASDSALPKHAIVHHVKELRAAGDAPDIVVLLQPTSPLRSVVDIDACIDAVERGADSAVTFVKSPVNPYRIWTIDDEQRPSPFLDSENTWLPRQQLPMTYAINGAVYAARVEALLQDERPTFIVGRAQGIVMPQERSIDIDTTLDFVLAEATMKHNAQNAS